MQKPQVFRTISEMKQWRRSQNGTVGFVPTMGALHSGHAELLRSLRSRCDRLVLSIFVNPTQFGPKEDLSKYPRTFESDLEVATRMGVDAIFFPTPAEMYPDGYSTYIEETRLSLPLCGAFRPGHFRGVATVVLKLFNIVQPRIAYFGLKDAQQFFVLKKMARDLELDVQVEGIPTVRENDGLAMSSRNVYLTTDERAKAPLIYRTLQEIVKALKGGATPKASLEKALVALSSAGFQPQYLELLHAPGLETVPENEPLAGGQYLVAIAAYLGTTRLIDNILFES